MDFKDDGGFPYSETTLRDLIKNMGFRYKEVNKRIGKLESPSLKDACATYLVAIDNYRENNRNIVFLDETW